MSKNNPYPTVRIRTLGCKVNFCDSAGLVEMLVESGFARAGKDAPADVEIVNTCAVTARGVQKARRLIRRVRSEAPGALIAAVGCAVRMGEKHLVEMPQTDLLCTTMQQAGQLICRRFGLEPAAASSGFDPERTRAFVKVQDGCDASCAYCVVPLVRPRAKSVPQDEALARVERALELGHREIVLSGTHLGRYGADLACASLPRLLERIASLGGAFRVRLSSIEPLEVSDELLDVMASSERICQHLHLPLQSGSDRVLRLMRRPYTAAEYMDTVERVRQRLDTPALTADIIAGFPGESERDHRATLELIGRARLARAHVFVFSPRPGTAAWSMGDRVDGRVAAGRSRQIRSLCEKSAEEFRRGLLGKTVEVLPENETDGFLEGFCRRYQRVRFPGGHELLGRLVRLKIVGEGGEDTVTMEGRQCCDPE